MAKQKVTDLKLLAIISDFIDEAGWAPSYKQISERSGLSSKSTVFDRLKRLEQAGLIKRQPNVPRALMLTETGCNAVKGLTHAG
ncbi:winged helix-turn-helix transcriptional regulator [Lactiplantibacillus brownii]|uniref:LexA family protein n=1 Tax=Lactiplantibacillus brownii TaxID=3069269 RepID=UPI0038B3B113